MSQLLDPLFLVGVALITAYSFAIGAFPFPVLVYVGTYFALALIRDALR